MKIEDRTTVRTSRRPKVSRWLSEYPVASEFDLERNVANTPDQVAAQSNDRFWWRCSVPLCGYRWEQTPNNRVGNGSGCPACDGKVVTDLNRLSLNCPVTGLLKQWDYEENGPLTPDDVSIGYGKKIAWSCRVADDHRWKDILSHRYSGRGCPCCAGHQLSSTNQLAKFYPELIDELDAELSGVTAYEVSAEDRRRRVFWKCKAGRGHKSWSTTPYSRIKHGPRCPDCRLRGTSAQELRLKAELACVLPIDPFRDQVYDASGRTARVDIVVDVEDVRLILEFDGSYIHEGEEKARNDAAKAARLRDAGWTVVRIREEPLEKLNAEFDVVVGFLAEPEDAAAVVLDHLVGLDMIPEHSAVAYRRRTLAGPQNTELASSWIKERLGRTALREERDSHRRKWERMFTALVSYEAESGHCYPGEGEVTVDQVDLGRWARKQRGFIRSSRLDATRAQRLQAIASWSAEPVYDASFRDTVTAYQEGLMDSRSATAWASNVRRKRQSLVDQGSDLPAWQLDALAQIPRWSWAPFDEEFRRKLDTLQRFAEGTGRPVGQIKQREKWEGNPVGVWVGVFRTKRRQLSHERQTALNALPGWTWNGRDAAWDEMFEGLKNFADLNHHIKPSTRASDDEERALAVWKRNNKSRPPNSGDRAARLRKLLAEYGETLAT